jgi:hypothetical protein
MRQGRIGSPAIVRILQVLQGQIGPLDSIAISFLQNLPTDHSTRSAVIEKTFRDLPSAVLPPLKPSFTGILSWNSDCCALMYHSTPLIPAYLHDSTTCFEIGPIKLGN